MFKNWQDDWCIHQLEQQTSIHINHGFKRRSFNPASRHYEEFLPLTSKIIIHDELVSALGVQSSDSHLGVREDLVTRFIYIKYIGPGNHKHRKKIVTQRRGNSIFKYVSIKEPIAKAFYNGPAQQSFSADVPLLLGQTIKGIKVAQFKWPDYPYPVPAFDNPHHAQFVIDCATAWLIDNVEN